MLRVFVLANDDLTSHVIFSPLFASAKIRVVGVGFSTTFITKVRNPVAAVVAVLHRVGVRYWSYLVFTNGCFRIFDRLMSRLGGAGGRNWPASLRRSCRVHGVPVYRRDDFNTPDFVDILRREAIDVLVIRVNQILKPQVLAVPRHGTWCVHSSLLPSYRGIAAEFHTLRNRDPLVGTTIFEVDEKLDHGDRLYQWCREVDHDRSVFWHMIHNNCAAGQLLRERLDAFDGSRQVRPDLCEHDMPSSHFTWPTAEQVRRLRGHGGRLIRWRECATLLLRCTLLFGR